MRKKLLGLVVVIILILLILYFVINPIPQTKNYEIENKKFYNINEINKNITFFNEEINITIDYWKVKLYQSDIEVNVTDVVNFKIEIISDIDIKLSNIALNFNDTLNIPLEGIYLNKNEIIKNKIYETNYTITGSEKNYRFILMDGDYNRYFSKEFEIKLLTQKNELNIKITFDNSHTKENKGLYFFRWTEKENSKYFPSFVIIEGSYKNSDGDHSINIVSNFNLYILDNKSLIIGFTEFLSKDALRSPRSYTPKCFIESDFHLPPGKYEIHCYYRDTGYGYEDPWKIMILDFEIS